MKNILSTLVTCLFMAVFVVSCAKKKDDKKAQRKGGEGNPPAAQSDKAKKECKPPNVMFKKTGAKEACVKKELAKCADTEEQVPGKIITCKAKPAPVADAPVVDTPAVDTPAVDTPGVDTPGVDTPGVEAPVVDAPVVDAPANAQFDANFKAAEAAVATSDASFLSSLSIAGGSLTFSPGNNEASVTVNAVIDGAAIELGWTEGKVIPETGAAVEIAIGVDGAKVSAGCTAEKCVTMVLIFTSAAGVATPVKVTASANGSLSFTDWSDKAIGAGNTNPEDEAPVEEGVPDEGEPDGEADNIEIG